MSISTRRGDEGMTDLMFGRRVPKTHPRMATLGAVDELNAALGVVRAGEVPEELREWVDGVQSRLVGLMGVIATHEEDHAKYQEKGYQGITGEDVSWLDDLVQELEQERRNRFRGWSRPGKAGALSGVQLDVARTIGRRAELCSWSVEDEALSVARQFLNRLSDVLWLLAREGEKQG
ncbi:cob(I)alamin adenosyltransferase [Rubritalea squalenifaciens DSM 18772]|uniref:Corrinoid adenosyltransferase n=1 Tax=Rubritalea squalenifaciens DSM 18772 TaxID=1123071 RepID=A0A1M6PGU9_9BACT|nr:cob(I)yrinic acid a,c-diamide adenosyltransferase [Rubritalea squalenifaciens]SHK07153.1 cob(I)alamin adenosyltransferase [Rubritalea squalenifaciens DSM 18772]